MLRFSEKLISESVVVARGSGFGRSDHPPDFKSTVSTYSTIAAYRHILIYIAGEVKEKIEKRGLGYVCRKWKKF